MNEAIYLIEKQIREKLIVISKATGRLEHHKNIIPNLERLINIESDEIEHLKKALEILKKQS